MRLQRILGIVLLPVLILGLSGCSDSAKEASGKDTANPTSTTKPPAGKFNTTQTVQLSCDDQRGSGCAATYYTLNGQEPDTNSEKYTEPFTIDKSTTVKYFSIDGAGNKEATQTAVFTFDQVAPKVVSSDPPNGGANVPLNGAEVTVTFDEDIEPATISPASISVNNSLGALKGAVRYDRSTGSATIKIEEKLTAGIQHTIKLNKEIKDVAGNTIEPVEIKFYSASIAWVVMDGALVKMTSASSEIVRINEVSCKPLGQKINLAMDEISESIWVVDQDNDRLMKFDRNGKLLVLSDVKQPQGLAVDTRDGSVWVGEDGLEYGDISGKLLKKIIRFDTNGNRLAESGEGLDIYTDHRWPRFTNPIVWHSSDTRIWLSSFNKFLQFSGQNSDFSNFDLSAALQTETGKNYTVLTKGYEDVDLALTSNGEGQTEFWVGEYDTAALHSLEGKKILQAEVATDAGYLRYSSIDRENKNIWFSSGEGRVAKYSADGKLLLNKNGYGSVDQRFAGIQADTVDHGAWLGYEGALVKLSSSGDELWRLADVSVSGIVVQPAYYNEIYVSEKLSDENSTGNRISPFGSIQKAINIANEGDSIFVNSGHYGEDLSIDKSLKLVGMGADATSIQGSGNANTIEFLDVYHATLSGLNIAGSNEDYSAAVLCSKCLDLVFTNNNISSVAESNTLAYGLRLDGDDNLYQPESGCCIDGYDTHPIEDTKFTRALIQNNSFDNFFEGIYLFAGQIIVRNNVFIDNGVAISVGYSQPVSFLYNNTMDKNGNGVHLSGSAYVHSNIVANGSRPGIAGYGSDIGFMADIQNSYNNLFNNSNSGSVIAGNYEDNIPGKGAISDAPLFVDPVNGVYQLQPDSTSRNAGSPNENPDVTKECGSLDSRNDMGAYGGLWGDW